MHYSQRQRLRSIICALLAFLAIGLILRVVFGTSRRTTSGHGSKELSKILVVASQAKEDVSWIHKHLPDWTVRRYVVDSSWARHTVPKNKGREAMAYLSYIIDSYDSLPDVSVFMHSARYQWHNDDPLYDAVPTLRDLQLPHVLARGYVNLRCVWTLGCPGDLSLSNPPTTDSPPALPNTDLPLAGAYPDAFHALFPGHPLPEAIGVPCCAQFAVSRSTIRWRPREEYERFRTWLLETDLPDYISGRVFEYSWHMIFGMPSVTCPDAATCYCETYGRCAVQCESQDMCEGRWVYPPSSTLPKGWPTIGWEKETRTDEELERLKMAGLKTENTSGKS